MKRFWRRDRYRLARALRRLARWVEPHADIRVSISATDEASPVLEALRQRLSDQEATT